MSEIIEVRRAEGLVIGPEDRLIVKIDSRYIQSETAGELANALSKTLGVKKALVVYAPLEATEFEVMKDESNAAKRANEEQGLAGEGGGGTGEGFAGDSEDGAHLHPGDATGGNTAVSDGEVSAGF